MHDEILSDAQRELLPLMAQFRDEFYLVGGTAIALHLGHRRSIDFDMFTQTALHHRRILGKLSSVGGDLLVTRRVEEQLNLVLHGVKLTFFQYPFPVEPEESFGETFRIPSLLSLAAMKAYALGRRSKWKDYVDLHFLLASHFSIAEVSAKAKEIFGPLFSEKMFRAQLSFFADVDYSEEVDYLVSNPPSNDEIMANLMKLATEGV